jgi:hypothetical protein
MEKTFKPSGAKSLGKFDPKGGKHMGTFHPDSGKAEGVHHVGHEHTHEKDGKAHETKDFHFNLKPGSDGMR